MMINRDEIANKIYNILKINKVEYPKNIDLKTCSLDEMHKFKKK